MLRDWLEAVLIALVIALWCALCLGLGAVMEGGR